MLNHYIDQWNAIAIISIFAIILGAIIILFSFLFSISSPDTEKVSAYECGFEPYEDARNLYDVRFYLVSVLFILFDLEAIYFFPWLTSLSYIGIDGYYTIVDFAIELLIGYIYAVEVGAFEW